MPIRELSHFSGTFREIATQRQKIKKIKKIKKEPRGI